MKGVFVTEQPSLRDVLVPAIKVPLEKNNLDFEYDDELLKATYRLLDEAKLVRVHPVHFELSVVKSQLKEMAFMAEAQLQMAKKSFRIDIEYLEKKWRRQYRQGYAFPSELAAKEEREYGAVEEAIKRCERRVSRLEELMGD